MLAHLQLELAQLLASAQAVQFSAFHCVRDSFVQRLAPVAGRTLPDFCRLTSGAPARRHQALL